MKNILFRPLLFSWSLLLFFGSCVKDDSFDAPKNTLITYEFTPSITVEDVQNKATTTPQIFTTDDIMEAYVTSSDEKSNFYKSISFQTLSSQGAKPIGFSIPINVTTLYGKGFTPGRKIYIKMKGLYFAKVYGALQVGSLEGETIGRISEFEWENHLFPSATIVPEEDLVRILSLEEAYADENQNTLIELKEVEFSDSSINRTYYDVDSGGGATNHWLVSLNGHEQVIRFSKFCPFTGKLVPELSGKIRGVLTKYEDTFQFLVRYEHDIQLTLPRFDQFPPIIGSSLIFFPSLFETFTSFGSSDMLFPNYINDAIKGSKYWQVKSSGSNKFLQMSSFGGTPETNTTVFIIPVDFSLASSFSFKTKSGYDNGSPLKVYYSLNYVPRENLIKADLVDITNYFKIPNGPPSGYASSFTSTGIYSIPNTLLGNGYFILEYNGNGNNGITTTMQIDEIEIN